MGLSFTKIIFGVLILGVILTGFVKFGGEIASNKNLDTNTAQYLININSSIGKINNMSVQSPNITTGSTDSFSKQYKESKLYAKTANNMLSTAGDTPNILIKTLDVSQTENKWFIDYITLGIKIMVFAIIIYMLFGRKF